MSRMNQIHTHMYCFESREPCVSWIIITKLAMMVKMLLEMLYQRPASEVVPVSLLALKPSVKGIVAAIKVSRTKVTSRRESEGEDWVAKLVGVDIFSSCSQGRLTWLAALDSSFASVVSLVLTSVSNLGLRPCLSKTS